MSNAQEVHYRSGWKIREADQLDALVAHGTPNAGVAQCLQLDRALHGLGRDEEAPAQLRRAVEVHDVRLVFIGVDPKWDALRGSPAFHAVLSRVNLLDLSNQVQGRR